jgi:leucyl aminopeptidase
MQVSFAKNAKAAVPVNAVRAGDLKRWLATRSKREAAYLKGVEFTAKEGDLRLIPGAQGEIVSAVLGLGKGEDILALATFSESLPAGNYRFADVPQDLGGANGALAWALGTYEFTRYKKAKPKGAKLVLPAGVDGAEIARIAEAIFLISSTRRPTTWDRRNWRKPRAGLPKSTLRNSLSSPANPC